MRVVDKIANVIIEELEESENMALFEIKEDKYLDVECAIADIISREISRYLNYDIDLNQFMGCEP